MEKLDLAIICLSVGGVFSILTVRQIRIALKTYQNGEAD